MTQQQPFPGSEFPSIPGEPLNLEPIEKALLKMCYGVHVIGSVSGSGERNLMIADWVMQVSFKPRLVAASIENDARTLRFVRETNAFTVNLLHERDGHEIARKVVMPAEGKKIRGRSAAAAAAVTDKLEGLAHFLTPEGAPILVPIAAIVGSRRESVNSGTLAAGRADARRRSSISRAASSRQRLDGDGCVRAPSPELP